MSHTNGGEGVAKSCILCSTLTLIVLGAVAPAVADVIESEKHDPVPSVQWEDVPGIWTIFAPEGYRVSASLAAPSVPGAQRLAESGDFDFLIGAVKVDPASGDLVGDASGCGSDSDRWSAWRLPSVENAGNLPADPATALGTEMFPANNDVLFELKAPNRPSRYRQGSKNGIAVRNDVRADTILVPEPMGAVIWLGIGAVAWMGISRMR